MGFSGAMSRQHAVPTARATRGAFFLEFLNWAGPRPDQLAVASGRWGDALRRHVREEFGGWLGIGICCEQLPDDRNSVSLDPSVTDYFGNPVPRLRYHVGPDERKALDDAKAIARRILEALGLSSGLTFAAHQMGTHRMGPDPRTSVVERTLRAHDVPNLYLVGGGDFVTASASPPTLTIAALAICAARHVAARVRPPRQAERRTLRGETAQWMPKK
jgi:choline dehydrogenase-like flavoprotein